MQKITRYLLHKLPFSKKSVATRCKLHSILVVEFALCKKPLVTRCKICLILVEKVVLWKKVTRYSLQKLLFAKSH